MLDHRLLLVRVAQFVGAGRAIPLPGLSPAIAVLLHSLGEMPASLQLAGSVILAAGLFVAVTAPVLVPDRASPVPRRICATP